MKMTTNRKLFEYSTIYLLSACRLDDAFGREFTKTSGVDVIFRHPRDFGADLHPTDSSDRIDPKKLLIERSKSYRIMCMFIKLHLKLLEL